MSRRKVDKISTGHQVVADSPVDSTPFDHAVINLRYAVDEGALLFRSLGFTVTPRGYHSLGSINHLMVFEKDYLELVGLDAADPFPRTELLDSPAGLNGLVFRSVDATDTHARLKARGIPVFAPRVFSREIVINGSTHPVSFRTVKVQPHVFPPGRLYFCQHLTPERVWHPSFQHHVNTAIGIGRVIIATETPEEDAATFTVTVQGRMADPSTVDAGGVKVEFCRTQWLTQLYGELIDLTEERSHPRLVGLSIRVQSIVELNASLAAMWTNPTVRYESRRTVVRASACFGVMLEFVQEQQDIAA